MARLNAREDITALYMFDCPDGMIGGPTLPPWQAGGPPLIALRLKWNAHLQYNEQIRVVAMMRACETTLEVIGFRPEQAKHLTRTLGLLVTLTNEEITSLCHYLRANSNEEDCVHWWCPWHTVIHCLVDYLCKPRNDSDVNLVVENNLKILVYYLKKVHCAPSEDIDVSALTLDKIWSLALYDRYICPLTADNHVHVATGVSAVPEIDKMNWPLMLSAMMERECCWSNISTIPFQHIAQEKVMAVPSSEPQESTTTALDEYIKMSYPQIKRRRVQIESP
jgi:hypothetical protein